MMVDSGIAEASFEEVPVSGEMSQEVGFPYRHHRRRQDPSCH